MANTTGKRERLPGEQYHDAVRADQRGTTGRGGTGAGEEVDPLPQISPERVREHLESRPLRYVDDLLQRWGRVNLDQVANLGWPSMSAEQILRIDGGNNRPEPELPIEQHVHDAILTLHLNHQAVIYREYKLNQGTQSKNARKFGTATNTYRKYLEDARVILNIKLNWLIDKVFYV